MWPAGQARLGYIIVEEPGNKCERRLEALGLQSDLVEEGGAQLRPGTGRHLLGRH